MQILHPFSRVTAAVPAVMLGVASATAGAADFELVASGPYASSFAEAVTFDGTDLGTLPPLLDLPRVEGGSFRATYRFAMVTPPPGLETSYTPGPPYGMTSFELLDAAGVVVHRGSDPFGNWIYVQDNDGSIPFSNDQVFLTSEMGDVTGSVIPTPLYSVPPDFVSVAGLNFSGHVDPDTNYTSDLGIPTDAATYLSFPFRSFDVLMIFADGDYVDRIAPYQYSEVQLTYDVTALTVSQVIPEPAALTLLAVGGGALRRRQH